MRRKNAFWVALATPGILWLAILFIVPFYAVLSIALGKLDQLIEAPVAVWNPLDWSSSGVIDVWRDIFGSSAFASRSWSARSSTPPSPRCCACSSATRRRTSSPGSPGGARRCSWCC